jgi:hypothetical protein
MLLWKEASRSLAYWPMTRDRRGLFLAPSARFKSVPLPNPTEIKRTTGSQILPSRHSRVRFWEVDDSRQEDLSSEHLDPMRLEQLNSQWDHSEGASFLQRSPALNASQPIQGGMRLL